MLDGRIKRDHLHAFVLAADDTAFESRMDRNDTRRVTKLFLVRFFHDLKQITLEIGFPSRVRSTEFNLCTGQRERRLNNRSQFFLAALYA